MGILLVDFSCQERLTFARVRDQRPPNAFSPGSRINEKGVNVRIGQTHETDRAIAIIDSEPQVGARQELPNFRRDVFEVLGRQEIVRGDDRRPPNRERSIAVARPGFPDFHDVPRPRSLLFKIHLELDLIADGQRVALFWSEVVSRDVEDAKAPPEVEDDVVCFP